MPLNRSIAALSFSAVSSERSPVSRIVFRIVALGAQLLAQLLLEARHLVGRDVVEVAVDARRRARSTCSSIGHGAYCGWFSVATIFSPRFSACCVAWSSSEPNCANASSSRYWARSRRRRPATFFIAFVCADEPTRETEMPTFTAGRTPEKKRSDCRKICPSVIEITFVGM